MAFTNTDDPSAHFQTTTIYRKWCRHKLQTHGNSDLAADLVWIKYENSRRKSCAL